MKRKIFKFAVLACASLVMMAGFSACRTTKERPVRFAIASDFHAPDIPDGEHRVATFIKAANDEKVDFIIELGDFCRLDSASQVYRDLWNSFPGDKYHARCEKYFPKGAGGILTFGIRGGVAEGRKFIDALKLFSLVANVADAKSLVVHPASTTHSQLDEEGLKAAGVSADMVRLSIGIEDEKDIIADLAAALEKSQED